jgi:hypothetical protein
MYCEITSGFEKAARQAVSEGVSLTIRPTFETFSKTIQPLPRPPFEIRITPAAIGQL